MQFQVPQFIEIEDKIFGPLTFKQFAYVIGGTGLSYIIYSLPFPFIIRVIFILPVAGFAFALAFYKVNGKPFIFTVEAAFKYFFAERLYLWQKQTKIPTATTVIKKSEEIPLQSFVPKLSDSKLKEISWGLDVIDTSRRK